MFFRQNIDLALITSDRTRWAVVPPLSVCSLKTSRSVGANEERYIISMETSIVPCAFSSHKKPLGTCSYNRFTATKRSPVVFRWKTSRSQAASKCGVIFFPRYSRAPSIPSHSHPGHGWWTSSFRFRTYLSVPPYGNDDALRVLRDGIVSDVSRMIENIENDRTPEKPSST